MGSDESESDDESEAGSISSALFDFSRQDQIQFEMGAAAILTTATFAITPSTFKGQIIRAAALILSVIAVFHWSVNTSRFSNEEIYFKHTYRVVEFLSIIVVFNLIHVVVSYTLLKLPFSVSTAVVHLVGAIVITLISIIFIEFIYKAYLLFWGAATYVYASAAANDAENSDNFLTTLAHYSLYNYSAQLSYLILRDNIPEGDSDELQDLREFVSEIEDMLDDEGNISLFQLFMVSAVIVGPVFAIIAYLLSVSVITVPFLYVLIILIATRIVKHIIEVPALIFGTLSFPNFLQTNLRSILTIAIYTTAVHWFFFV